MEPTLSITILCKNNNTLIRPLAIGPDRPMQPINQLMSLAIGTILCMFRPTIHLSKESTLCIIGIAKQRRSSFQSLISCFIQRIIVIALLLKLLNLTAQDAHTWSAGHTRMSRSLSQSLLMLFERRKES